MTIHLMQPNDILTIEAHNADTQIVNGFLKHYHQGHCTSGGGAPTTKGLPLSKGKASLVQPSKGYNRLMQKTHLFRHVSQRPSPLQGKGLFSTTIQKATIS